MQNQDIAQYTKWFVEQNLERYIEELRYLCLIDSPSLYKPGLDAMSAWCAQRMREIGMETHIVENDGGNDVYGVYRGTGEGTFLILGHLDTVYPVGTTVERPMKIENDHIIAPGASDMKGCVLSALYALDVLHQLDCKSYKEIRCLFVTDEEICNMKHSQPLSSRLARDCDMAFVLEEADDEAYGALAVARKGTVWYNLAASGRAAHAGAHPWNGRNAIVELSHQLLQFQQLNNSRSGLTINIGTISGGIAANVVADHAEAVIDLRYMRMQDRIDTVLQWQKYMEDRIVPDIELRLEPQNLYYQEPMKSTRESLHIAERAKQIAPHLDFTLHTQTRGGSSDGNAISTLGVPVLDGLGPAGARDHSPDEYLVLSSVAPRTALLAWLLASTGMLLAEMKDDASVQSVNADDVYYVGSVKTPMVV